MPNAALLAVRPPITVSTIVLSFGTRILRAIPIAALISGFSVAVAAPDEGMSFSLQGFPELPVSKSQAIAEAKRIQQQCARILALIPRLSPAEDAWLKGERAARRDLGNLMRRPEYA